jgi:hypothetical protein
MAKRRITPEERAEWAAARQGLADWLERFEERKRAREQREELRRARVHRFTFGLLGR